MCYLQHWMFNLQNFPRFSIWICSILWKIGVWYKCVSIVIQKFVHSEILEMILKLVNIDKKRKNLDYSSTICHSNFHIHEIRHFFLLFLFFYNFWVFFSVVVVCLSWRRKHLFLLFVLFCLLEMKKYQKKLLPSSASRYIKRVKHMHLASLPILLFDKQFHFIHPSILLYFQEGTKRSKQWARKFHSNKY